MDRPREYLVAGLWRRAGVWRGGAPQPGTPKRTFAARRVPILAVHSFHLPPICPPAALPPPPPPPCGSALDIYICLVSYRVVSSRYAWFVSWYIINKVPFYTPSLLFLVYFLCRMCLAPVSSCRYYAPGTKTGEEGTTMRARGEHERALFADPVAMLR